MVAVSTLKMAVPLLKTVGWALYCLYVNLSSPGNRNRGLSAVWTGAV